MASIKETLQKGASEMRIEDKKMDEKMTPEQLLQDIKDDLDLLFKKMSNGN